DVKQLRLTCKELGELLRPQVFRVLSINVTRNTLEDDVSKLRTLATTNYPASYGTRILYIRSLSPSYDPSYRGPVWKHVEGEWIAEAQAEDPPEVARAEEEVKRYLFNAISSLKGVQTVGWITHRKDDENAQKTVMDALKTLPNLRCLHVTIPNCKIPLSLDSISGLREISIVGTSEQYHEDTLDSLAKLVAKTPELISIEISSNWRYSQPINKTQSLHQVFKYYPVNASPLRLRHLGLKVCLVRLDEITMPHLRHLTSLNLTNIEDPNMRPRYAMGEEQEETQILKEQKRYGSSLQDVWKMLTQADVRLEEITVDVVVPSFLDYLSSYSGLKKLNLTPGGFFEGTRSDAMASEFFATPFAKHTRSLQELDIGALYEGSWCFGPHNIFAISNCQNLRKLRMSVISNEPRLQISVKKLFLDTVAISMPQLESLQIIDANLEQLRGAFCGNPAMAHFSHATRIMTASVNRYRAPPSCIRLPALTISSGRSFIPTSTFVGNAGDMDAEKGVMRYVDVSPASKETDYIDW
ncbi:hypothetical protein BDZ97DRAFT_1679083, partial [Flammula alnicola]